MEFAAFEKHQLSAVADLFERTFTASEGSAEGKVLGQLVRDLVTTTATKDLTGFCAVENNTVCGSIFFSRLQLETASRAFMLSPVAVSPEYQRKGVGQQLIGHGLKQLKSNNVHYVVTYGDPNYYEKSGFEPVGPDIIEAPYPLSYPQGWQLAPLNNQTLKPQGTAQCVEAFRNAAYW